MKVKHVEKIRTTTIVIITIILGITLTYFSEILSFGKYNKLSQATLENNALISQKVVGENNVLKSVQKLYFEGDLVGVITDEQMLKRLLKEHQKEYETDFPDRKLELGEDLYLYEESTYFEYEDIDPLIEDFIVKNDLFAVEAIRVEFSNGNVVYVKDIDDFEEAKAVYVLNFITEKDLAIIDGGGTPTDIGSDQYGSRTIDYEIKETASFSKGFASKKNILMDKNEIIQYLSYGFDTEKSFYTVVAYDTVEGVASKNGLRAQQVLTINSDKLISTDQLLQVGDQLNVTYFNSPISIKVTRERVARETIYPSKTKYIPDPTIREGIQRVVVREKNGYRRVRYRETYINGVLQPNAVLLDSKVMEDPIQEQIRYGTMIIPGIGSGNFRWPVANPVISCGWYCYAGHQAIDIYDRYVKYAPILASDRGVVDRRGYDSISGYFIWINHNNGYRTYYGHLREPAFFGPGTTVYKGEQIGIMGMTGRATGVHTHFMVEWYGRRINPCLVLGC